MNGPDLKKNLCFRFCSYYNPAKNKPVACRPFLLVEKLFKNGRKINFDIPVPVSNIRDRELISAICTECPFHENGCDFFMSIENAKPCGGYVFIKESVKAGTIIFDEIRKV